MKVPFVDLKAQYLSIRSEVDAAIQSVIDNTSFIGGEVNQAFEKSFAGYIGIQHCIGCGNGTDALEILLEGMGIRAGDEVIVPAHTWISTAETVSRVGGTPVFADTLQDSYTLDPCKLKERINNKTKDIVVVHLFGYHAEMDDIMKIARDADLMVLEDCAQAHGAEYQGKKVGTFGDAAAFSFYPGKNLGAYGDGGAMLTNDPALADKVQMIANHGQPKKNQHLFEGRNSRLDSLQAAVLDVKLSYLDRWTEMRIENAGMYEKYLSGLDIVLPRVADFARHVFHLYVVRVNNREKIQQYLKEQGIQTSVHYPTPLPLLPAYRAWNHRKDEFPVASKHSKQILSLPMFPELTEQQIQYICENLLDAVSKFRKGASVN